MTEFKKVTTFDSVLTQQDKVELMQIYQITYATVIGSLATNSYISKAEMHQQAHQMAIDSMQNVKTKWLEIKRIIDE